jgi:NodT family efflux transporter outer membrane factor (OMF) lipoprotein
MNRRTLPTAGLAALLCAGVSACAVGPSYRAPDTATQLAPAAFAEAAASSTPSEAQPHWWRLYDDAALDALVEKALTANTNLRQADANLRLAQAALSAVQDQRIPSTTLSAGGAYGRTANGSAPPPSATTRGNFGFSVAYDLDLFGRLRRGIEAAQADVATREAALDLARTQVAAETTRAYAQACSAARQADVARQSLRFVTDSYDITVRQRDLGASSDLNVARARTLLEQTRAPISRFEANRRSALYALSVLTGESPEKIDPAAAACRTPPRILQPLPVGDGRALLARRPDVRAAERSLAAAVARIGVATADLYPNISLGGSVSGVGVDLSTAASDRGLSFGIGPLLSWNLPNLTVARARIAQSRALAEGQLAAFDGTLLTALREAETALAVYSGELERNAALQAARDQSAEAYRIAKLQFEIGSTSFLDSLDAERTLVNADAELAASQAALAADQIDVFKALGGGWEQAPPVERKPLPTR